MALFRSVRWAFGSEAPLVRAGGVLLRGCVAAMWVYQVGVASLLMLWGVATWSWLRRVCTRGAVRVPVVVWQARMMRSERS